MVEIRRTESEAGRYTNIFLAAPDDVEQAKAEDRPLIELTYNWPHTLSSAYASETEVGKPNIKSEAERYSTGRNFGHLAYRVKNIYETCQKLMDNGIVINRPPRDGRMAFIRTPDGISIELLQDGESLPEQEPWASMENTGTW
jgi:lactoylglutathione lyase